MGDATPSRIKSQPGPDETYSKAGNANTEDIESFRLSHDGEELVRTVKLNDGTLLDSPVPCEVDRSISDEELPAAYEQSWLRLSSEPPKSIPRSEVRLVDLFSGCGAMTIGVAEACRALHLEINPLLAVDRDSTALDIYKKNFVTANLRNIGVEEIFNGELGANPTDAELTLAEELGDVDLVVGGPPCQGSSDLNNHTRRADPKNALYARMARAAEVLNPTHVIVENVLGIRHDKDDVFQETVSYFSDDLCDGTYSVDTGTIRSEEVGVPQTRHRVFLVASRKKDIDLASCIDPFRTATRDFSWACADLVRAQQNGSEFDTPSTPAPVTKERIKYLFDHDTHHLPDDMRPPCHRDNEHSYPAVYGRMWEDRPAPTITTGFTSMGQGRFVHPSEPRTITPHEAARLQFIPDFFKFGDLPRVNYKTLIGNAVPPKLTYLMALQLLR